MVRCSSDPRRISLAEGSRLRRRSRCRMIAVSFTTFSETSFETKYNRNVQRDFRGRYELRHIRLLGPVRYDTGTEKKRLRRSILHQKVTNWLILVLSRPILGNSEATHHLHL